MLIMNRQDAIDATGSFRRVERQEERRESKRGKIGKEEIIWRAAGLIRRVAKGDGVLPVGETPQTKS